MISVAAAIIFNQDLVLIARRSNGKHLAGYWEFPGGKIEANETPEECLVREIKEELGITITVNFFLTENIHHYAEKTILLKAYQCSFIGGLIELSDHDDIVWVLPEQLKDYTLAPADIPFINYLT